MRNLLLTFLSLLCVTTAMALEEPAKRTCRILFLDRPHGAPTKMHLSDGHTTREVDLPGMNLSPVHEMPVGALKLMLLAEPPADPAKPPEAAPSVEVPENIADFYLLVLSDPANPVAPVRLRVVDAEREKVMLGHTLWVNLTDLSISGKLGGLDLLLEPQGKTLVGQPRDGAGDFPVTMSYKAKDEETLSPICETRWIHDPRSSNLGFVIAPEEGDLAPRIMIFRDFR